MTLFRTIVMTMAAAAIVSLAAVMPAAAQARQAAADCLSDRQIQTAIESGQIQSWPRIKKLAGISSYQEVSEIQVCTIDGTLYYMLNVISPDGEASKIVLNAVDGTEELL